MALPKPKASKQVLATHLPPAELADAASLRALANGVADSHQQQRALKWIIEQAAGTYAFNFYPSERDTAFALGRAFVGQQIVGLLKLNVGALRRANEHQS